MAKYPKIMQPSTFWEQGGPHPVAGGSASNIRPPVLTSKNAPLVNSCNGTKPASLNLQFDNLEIGMTCCNVIPGAFDNSADFQNSSGNVLNIPFDAGISWVDPSAVELITTVEQYASTDATCSIVAGGAAPENTYIRIDYDWTICSISLVEMRWFDRFRHLIFNSGVIDKKLGDIIPNIQTVTQCGVFPVTVNEIGKNGTVIVTGN